MASSASSSDSISDALQSLLFDDRNSMGQLKDSTGSVKTLKKLASLVRRKRLNLSEDISHDLAAEFLNLLIGVLNDVSENDEHGLEKKELALQILDSLAELSTDNELVKSSLSSLSTEFENLLQRFTSLDEHLAKNLNTYVMSLLFRIFDYNLLGSEMLELTNHNVDHAIINLLSVLRAPSSSAEMKVAAAKTFLYLTLPSACFPEETGNGDAQMDQRIEILTKQFQKHVDTVMESCVKLDVIEILYRVMLPWVTHATVSRNRFGGHSAYQEPTHEMFYYMLQAINNLLFHSTRNTAKFRRQFALEVPIVKELIVPYMDLLLDELGEISESSDQSHAKYQEDTMRRIRLVLRVLVSGTYNIRALNSLLRDTDCKWRKFLQSELCTRDVYTLSLMVKLAINVSLDSLKQDHHENCAMKLSQEKRPLLESKECDCDMDTLHRVLCHSLSRKEKKSLGSLLQIPDPSAPVYFQEDRLLVKGILEAIHYEGNDEEQDQGEDNSNEPFYSHYEQEKSLKDESSANAALECQAMSSKITPYFEDSGVSSKAPHHLQPLNISNSKSFRKRQTQAVPDNLCCPISKQLMDDPVRIQGVTSDTVWDRQSLMPYIVESQPIPWLRKVISEDHLIKDNLIQNEILSWKLKHFL